MDSPKLYPLGIRDVYTTNYFYTLMNILLIEQYSKLIQDVIQNTDDILRAVVSNDKLRQNIKHEWYFDDDDTDWDTVLRVEESNYTFDPSIYPDNFFNE